MQTQIPALLDKNFKTKVVYYPEEEIHVISDDKGTDVLDKNFEYIGASKRSPIKVDSRFVSLKF